MTSSFGQSKKAEQMRKWDSVTATGLLNIIEYLKHNFDPELSRKVIALFHERMQDDQHIDMDVLYVLMKHVFAQIMEGRSADQAFGLMPIRGKHNRPDTYERDIRATAIVILNLRNGIKWDDAIANAAERLLMGESTAARACSEFRQALESLPDDDLTRISKLSPLSP